MSGVVEEDDDDAPPPAPHVELFEADPLEPLRAVARLGLAVLIFTAVAVTPLTAIGFLTVNGWRAVALDDPATTVAREIAFAAAVADTLGLAMALGLAFGLVRAVDAVAWLIRPEASLARALGQAALAGYVTFAGLYLGFLQLRFLGGVIEGLDLAANLKNLNSETPISGHDLGEFAGLALVFAVVAFTRARRLGLGLATVSTTLVSGAWLTARLVPELGTAWADGGVRWPLGDELAFWTTALLAAVLAPAFLRGAAWLEGRWTPRSLVPVTEWRP